MTGCKGEDCPFYVEYWADVDRIGDVCSHPKFDEMKHSIKLGVCPFMDEVEEAQASENGEVR